MSDPRSKITSIIGIVTIRLKQLRDTDLNLLVYLFVLMEEQGISRAAKRMGLTQPSVSRALKRLRDLFDDELLMRTPKGYEPTQRGQALLDELAVLLPQIEHFITGQTSDALPRQPTRAQGRFAGPAGR